MTFDVNMIILVSAGIVSCHLNGCMIVNFQRNLKNPLRACCKSSQVTKPQSRWSKRAQPHKFRFSSKRCDCQFFLRLPLYHCAGNSNYVSTRLFTILFSAGPVSISVLNENWNKFWMSDRLWECLPQQKIWKLLIRKEKIECRGGTKHYSH